MTTEVLDQRDATRLAELEVIIEHGVRTFVEVGTALAEIRDQRLYRETHSTFDTYCRERWAWSRQRAHQLIEAAQVSTVVDVPNERQARELAPLLNEPEQLKETWAEIIAKEDERVTAEKIKQVMAKHRDIPDPDPQMLLDERPCPTCGRWTPQWVIARVEPPEGQKWRWLSVRGKALSRKARNQRNG